MCCCSKCCSVFLLLFCFFKYEIKHTVSMMAISIHSLTAKCCNVTWISCLLHFNFYLGKNSMEIYFVIYLKRHVCNPPMMIAIFGIKTDPQQQHFNHSYYNRRNQTVILHTFIFILVIASGKTSGWECFTLLSLIENVPWKDVSQDHSQSKIICRRGYAFKSLLCIYSAEVASHQMF